MEGDNPIKCTVHCGSKEICSPGCEGGEIQIEIDGNKKTIDVDCKRKPGQGGFNCDTTRLGPVNPEETTTEGSYIQGGFDGRGHPTASPMLTAIMIGGVGISGRDMYKYR